MIKIDTQTDPNQGVAVKTMLAECPVCGQKLCAAETVEGLTVLRVKCRRCRRYIRVFMIGVK